MGRRGLTDRKTPNEQFGSTAVVNSYSVSYTLIPVILFRHARDAVDGIYPALDTALPPRCRRHLAVEALGVLPLATSYANTFAVIPRGRTVNLLTQLLDCSGAPLTSKPARGGSAEK